MNRPFKNNNKSGDSPVYCMDWWRRGTRQPRTSVVIANRFNDASNHCAEHSNHACSGNSWQSPLNCKGKRKRQRQKKPLKSVLLCLKTKWQTRNVQVWYTPEAMIFSRQCGAKRVFCLNKVCTAPNNKIKGVSHKNMLVAPIWLPPPTEPPPSLPL